MTELGWIIMASLGLVIAVLTVLERIGEVRASIRAAGLERDRQASRHVRAPYGARRP